MTDDELKGMFQALRQDNAEIRDDVAADIAAAHVETRRHFDVAVEAFRHEVLILAESVGQMREDLVRTAGQLDEKIERTTAETQAMIKFSHAELDTKIERTATETQAMIKFSHAELDRRMRTLEETQSRLEDALEDLQTRVERLEGSTH